MIKIGKDYYRNLWAFIRVGIFRRPNLRLSEPVEFIPIYTEAQKKKMMDRIIADIDKRLIELSWGKK